MGKYLQKKKNAILSVHYIADTRMTSLNKKYRKKNKTTDVLSFSINEGDHFFNSEELGDIFVSIPQIRKQAKERGLAFKDEFFRMLIHGILHLLGFDHITEKQEREMFALQEKYLKKFV